MIGDVLVCVSERTGMTVTGGDHVVWVEVFKSMLS